MLHRLELFITACVDIPGREAVVRLNWVQGEARVGRPGPGSRHICRRRAAIQTPIKMISELRVPGLEFFHADSNVSAFESPREFRVELSGHMAGLRLSGVTRFDADAGIRLLCGVGGLSCVDGSSRVMSCIESPDGGHALMLVIVAVTI